MTATDRHTGRNTTTPIYISSSSQCEESRHWTHEDGSIWRCPQRGQGEFMGSRYPCTSHNRTPISTPERGRAHPPARSSLAPREGTRTLSAGLVFSYSQLLPVHSLLFSHHCCSALFFSSFSKKNTKSGFPGCRLLGIFTFKWIEKGLQPKAREKFKFDCRSPLVRQGLLLLIHHSDWKADTLADSNPLTNPFRSTSLSLNPHHTTGIPLPKPKPRRTTHSPTERSP